MYVKFDDIRIVCVADDRKRYKSGKKLAFKLDTNVRPPTIDMVALKVITGVLLLCAAVALVSFQY